MHKIHHSSCYCPEFLNRIRNPKLTDPLVDLLGSDIPGINNLFIWKAPEIGLRFPWHQDKFYFPSRLNTPTTLGTWTAIDHSDEGNGCLYFISGSHKREISICDDLEGSQQKEYKLERDAKDEEKVPVEAALGTVIWFHNHLLHKSTDIHSDRLRRSYVSHYLSAQAEWPSPEKADKGQPVTWIRWETFSGKVTKVTRDVLPLDSASG